MYYHAQKKGLTISVYQKGPKVLLQGKGAQEFIEFYLEPEILKATVTGYDEVHHPEYYTPHFGVDESGKGDFFGPLVIAGAFTNEAITRELQNAGVMDSKRIKSDDQIRSLASSIRKICNQCVDVILISPTRYNELYPKFRNLNRMLAWGHAQVIENLLKKVPDCPRTLSDQFTKNNFIQRELDRKKIPILFEQRTKAESDPAVAAASIIARAAFINWMDQQSEKYSPPLPPLPRGSGANTKIIATEIVKFHGPEIFREIAKTHFKTASEIAPGTYPPPHPTFDFY